MHLPFLPRCLAPLPTAAIKVRRQQYGLRAAGLVLLLSGVSAASNAQAVQGAGADAVPIPKGTLRFSVSGNWDLSYDEYTPVGKLGVRSTLHTSSLDVRFFPQLSAAEQAIRALSKVSSFTLTHGPLSARGDERKSTTPFNFQFGITSRLSVGLVVPYVESRDNSILTLNENGVDASVGQNPAYSSTNGATARSANGTLLRQLSTARTQLAAEITRCAVPTATGCDAIRADPAGAASLLQKSTDAQTAIVTIYGDSVRGGAPVVPINNSSTQTAINTTINDIRAAFASFGVTAIAASSLPASALIVNGPGSLPRIANDTAYGLDYERLGNTRRSGIGDVDLTATFLWLNTLGARPSQWLAARSFGVRSVVTGGWRFGSAGADRTNDAFDVPNGDGANALLLRSTTDVVINRWVWLSGTVRAVQPFGDQVVIRRPLFDDSLLFVPSTVQSADRSLGRRVDLELAPRVTIGQFFGVSGGYLYRRGDGDEYTFAAGDASEAATLSRPSTTYQAYMYGATFSTLSSYVRGRARWPVEVLYVHTGPITGSGNALAMTTDRLELRLYFGFPRR